ncbi:glycosyltransferase [Deferribacterales bacterium Es71-Z0220]|uniref:glycosyltransferase family 4 protein n=1 Tax=Deferrivibrio essentukiensis TaxID=2880922 RepID=UPI001F60013E|nr:glycosyltransferase [Deferrivibrio essentukiensis]MCB4205188.1 glycosyltransferase [Deferrivibrio essentukiensis]
MLISVFIFSFLISFLLIAGVVFSFDKLGRFIADDFSGPQKYHTAPTPRVGGIGIYVGFLLVLLYLYFYKKNVAYLNLIISTVPVFFIGLIEDIAKRVSPNVRLISAALSAYLAYYFMGICLNRIDIPLADYLFSLKIFAVAFTIFAIAGLSNAVNIIDGYNGLSAIVSVMILSALGYVAYQVGDGFIFTVAVVVIGAILGFFVWNFPFGKIFLGDGGAYFIGFIIGVLSVLLVQRHKEVSAWFPLVVSIYPIFETIFSFYRKKYIKKMSPFKPDSFHLHMLIYKRVVPQLFNIVRNEKLMRNSATSPFLWLICSLGVIPGAIFWKNTPALIIFTLVFCVFYVWLYRSIVRFKLMKMLKRGNV